MTSLRMIYANSAGRKREQTISIPHNLRQHNITGTPMRRSVVTHNMLTCFLAILGLTSCILLGYMIGLQINQIAANHEHSSSSSSSSSSSQFFHLYGGNGNNLRSQRTTSSFTVQDELRWNTIPDGWQNYTFSDIRHYFNCLEHAHDQTKLLPTLDEWNFIRKQMKLLVDPRLNLNDPVPPTRGYSLGNTTDPPPYYAQLSKGKGRGLFASRNIRKGELVHDGPQSCIVFPNAISFRRLVFALPRTSGCDITEWAWHQELSSATNAVTNSTSRSILVDANIAAFMNSSPEPNIAPQSNTDTRFYAIRDIGKDEEILQDYSVYKTDWNEVGLGW